MYPTLLMNNIKGEEHYKSALKRIQTLMQSNPAENSDEYKEMDMLVSLVEAYEEIYSPMIASDPIEYLRYKMNQNGIKQRDLIDAIGSKYAVSKVLNRKQSLTLEMIKKLSAYFQIPAVRLMGIS
jgi:HTH-type transcriptional regulator/antitoxin HigA